VTCVLVVDDDDDIRELTKLSLETVMGWEVLVASGGPEAIDTCRLHRPDAVLMDMMMPGMDGLTAFQHLQADRGTRDIPVILFTARSTGDARQPWADQALRGVIKKPYDPMALGDEVSELLGWPTSG
jgi:CheY-like chemotaxis protein